MSPAQSIQVILATLAFALVLGTISTRLEAVWPGEHRFGRKAAHVGVFSGAAAVQLWAGFWGVVTFGSMVTGLYFAARLTWPKGGPFEALRRSGASLDGRGEILVPYVATILGGASTTLLLGDLALVGYLVCGWGDPFGAWLGRKVGVRRALPPFGPKGSGEKTIAGTVGVFAAGSLGAVAGLSVLGIPVDRAILTGAACAATGAVAEAVARSETDNFWLQLVPALTAWWILG